MPFGYPANAYGFFHRIFLRNEGKLILRQLYKTRTRKLFRGCCPESTPWGLYFCRAPPRWATGRRGDWACGNSHTNSRMGIEARVRVVHKIELAFMLFTTATTTAIPNPQSPSCANLSLCITIDSSSRKSEKAWFHPLTCIPPPFENVNHL